MEALDSGVTRGPRPCRRDKRCFGKGRGGMMFILTTLNDEAPACVAAYCPGGEPARNPNP